MSKITEQVEVIVQPIMGDLNFELVDVEYVKEGRDHFLRISIDKEGGVDLNEASRKMKLWMQMILFLNVLFRRSVTWCRTSN